ncbi:hypothetical protein H1R20_g3155, partial [Candolleomyces eurysporus]
MEDQLAARTVEGGAVNATPQGASAQPTDLRHHHHDAAKANAQPFFLSGPVDIARGYGSALCEQAGEPIEGICRCGEESSAGGEGWKVKEEPIPYQGDEDEIVHSTGSSVMSTVPIAAFTSSMPKGNGKTPHRIHAPSRPLVSSTRRQNGQAFLPPPSIYYSELTPSDPTAVVGVPVSNPGPRTSFPGSESAPLFYAAQDHIRPQVLATPGGPPSIAATPLASPSPSTASSMGPPPAPVRASQEVTSKPSVTSTLLGHLPHPDSGTQYLKNAMNATTCFILDLGLPRGPGRIGWSALFRRYQKRLMRRGSSGVSFMALSTTQSVDHALAPCLKGKPKPGGSRKKPVSTYDPQSPSSPILDAAPPSVAVSSRRSSQVRVRPSRGASPSFPQRPVPVLIAPKLGKSRTEDDVSMASSDSSPQSESLPYFALIAALMAVGAFNSPPVRVHKTEPNTKFGTVNHSESPSFLFALSQQALGVWLDDGQPLPEDVKDERVSIMEMRADFLRACLIGLHYLMDNANSPNRFCVNNRKHDSAGRQAILSLLGKMVSALRSWGFAEGLLSPLSLSKAEERTNPPATSSTNKASSSKSKRGSGKSGKIRSTEVDSSAGGPHEGPEDACCEKEESRIRLLWDVYYYDFELDSDPKQMDEDANEDQGASSSGRDKVMEEIQRMQLEQIYSAHRASWTRLAFTVKRDMASPYSCCGHTLDQAVRMENAVKEWMDGVSSELHWAFKHGVESTPSRLVAIGKAVLNDDLASHKNVSGSQASSQSADSAPESTAYQSRRRILGCELALMAQFILFRIFSPFMSEHLAKGSPTPKPDSSVATALRHLRAPAQAIIHISNLMHDVWERSLTSKRSTFHTPPSLKPPLLRLYPLEQLILDATLVCSRICCGFIPGDPGADNPGMDRCDPCSSEMMLSIGMGLTLLERFHGSSQRSQSSAHSSLSSTPRPPSVDVKLVELLRKRWEVKNASFAPPELRKRDWRTMEEYREPEDGGVGDDERVRSEVGNCWMDICSDLSEEEDIPTGEPQQHNRHPTTVQTSEPLRDATPTAASDDGYYGSVIVPRLQPRTPSLPEVPPRPPSVLAPSRQTKPKKGKERGQKTLLRLRRDGSTGQKVAPTRQPPNPPKPLYTFSTREFKEDGTLGSPETRQNPQYLPALERLSCSPTTEMHPSMYLTLSETPKSEYDNSAMSDSTPLVHNVDLEVAGDYFNERGNDFVVHKPCFRDDSFVLTLNTVKKPIKYQRILLAFAPPLTIMDINIFFIPRNQNKWAVTRALAQRIHEDESSERKVNFKVNLNPDEVARVGHNGKGTLTLPSKSLGSRFLNEVRNNPVELPDADGSVRKLRFNKSNKPPRKDVTETLEKTLFVSPDVEEKHSKIVADLEAPVRLESVQLGLYHRPNGSSGREFSIEWPPRDDRESYTAASNLKFEYDRKLIRITLGDMMTDRQGRTIAINIASINRIAVGRDFGKPYACFDTLTPPVFERISFYRGDDQYRLMEASLDPAHKVVAPYATQTRIVLFDARKPGRDIVREFIDLCGRAGISPSRIMHCNVPATREQRFCSENKIPRLRETLGTLPWSAAFQMEALLHNGLLDPGSIKNLLPHVQRLCKEHRRDGSIFVGELLRAYKQVLQSKNVPGKYEDPIKTVFQNVRSTFTLPNNTHPSGNSTIRCGHVTFTPTRMILEGPYPTQSNRIIRKYSKHSDHFIRVDFRDEDRLPYRWDRSVDPTAFLQSRVGGILKGGFFLGGRHFEFLGYSNSGLREHEVWFMFPIDCFSTTTGETVRVDGQYIWNEIGDFHGTLLMKQPSKYAARIAQAFTSTESSTSIDRLEWEEVEDLGQKPYLFTDGAGTISKNLGDRIWKELCKDGRRSNSIQPSVYQIRFLGYKGVVSVDREMDNVNEQREPGEPHIHMKLRPSMKKFENSNMEKAEIEIAQAFCAPNVCYLNRPLVVLLEDLGVRKEAFEKLQDNAIADAKTIDDGIEQFYQFVSSHSLGGPFGLPGLLRRLRDLGLDTKPSGSRETTSIDGPFLRLLRSVAINDVLRDIRHKARIPIPGNYLLVGIADEGVAWQKAGRKDVVTLSAEEIYVVYKACIQRPGDKDPTWIEGSCAISRSPVVHPGDVQRVYAIGKPPDEGFCAFRGLVNVVVLPSVGGGDVDGDQFSIITDSSLLPDCREEPAEYTPVDPYELPDGRESTVNDICDFIVEYIRSDVLGLLCDRQLVMADQLKDGLKNPKCRKLAELCSQAVDYQKQGNPVNMNEIQMWSKTPIRRKPDWHATAVVSDKENTDYYLSTRALGHLCRNKFLQLPDITEADKELSPSALKPLADPISRRLMPHVKHHLGENANPTNANPTGEISDLESIFRHYVQELDYICLTHSLSNNPREKLTEAEVVAEVILEESLLKSLRKARVYRMRTHSEALVKDVQIGLRGKALETDEDKLTGLKRAWRAWEFSQRSNNKHGSNSFGIIALGVVFECLEKLGTVF